MIGDPLANIPPAYQMYLKRQLVKEGHRIIEPDLVSKGIYFIASGKVAVKIILANGESLFFNELVAGNFFGEAELFSEKPSTYEIIPLTELELYYLPHEQIRAWMKKDFSLTEYLFKELSDKLEHGTRYVVVQKEKTTYEYLLDYLKELPLNVPLDIVKADIAFSLNTSLRNLNRAFTRAQENGVLLWENKELVVLKKYPSQSD